MPGEQVKKDALYRPDIDGLRAIAVLAVVGYHAAPRVLRSGFFGVDVFFVISGFLISGLILHGLKAGDFSFIDFYVRRARRLFPALVVVLAAMWAVGWFALWPKEFVALGNHMIAGAAFAANVLLYSEVGYFDPPAETKPLLHLWSLGVEEQFYIVFPLLLLLIWRSRSALVIMTLVAIGSFVASVATARNYPAFSFYMPVTRFWEFLAGATLAYVQFAFGRPTWLAAKCGNLRVSDAVAGVGLLVILCAVLVPNSSPLMRSWVTAAPILGAFMVIAAGSDAWANKKLLAHKNAVWIGLISYPLYLWHWPLLVAGRTFARDYSHASWQFRATIALAVLASFVLAWLTYRFIERPIRYGASGGAARLATAGCGACLVAVTFVGLATARSNGFLNRFPADIQVLLAPAEVDEDFAFLDEPDRADGPLLMIIGDSHARHLLHGLRRLQDVRQFRLRSQGWGCGPTPMVVIKSGAEWPSRPQECSEAEAQVRERVARLKPDIVVMSAFWLRYDYAGWISETVGFFRQVGVRRIVILGSAPFWPERPQTLLFNAFINDPSHRIPTRLSGFSGETGQVDQNLRAIASTLGVRFVSVTDILCDDDLGCLVRLGLSAEDLVQVDTDHLSPAGSDYLVSRLAPQILDGPPRSPPPTPP